jgi:predicted amidohydrolase
MSTKVRIALANLRFPATAVGSIESTTRAVVDASRAGADVVCFPECFVPGYRSADRSLPAPDARLLEGAWQSVADTAATAGVTVVLGTERIVDGQLRASAIVINRDGLIAGFQDKVQIDPSEEGTYAPGTERRLFRSGPLTFGVVICHEGWRYPETVRWAARQGAEIVFHLQFHEAEGDSYRPEVFGDPANTFHEKALLCRAAENTCFFATVNYASAGAPTTSAVVNPDGTLLAYQPYGKEGLLVADLELAQATRLLARRYKPLT